MRILTQNAMEQAHYSQLSNQVYKKTLFYERKNNYKGTLAILEYYNQEDETFYYTLDVFELNNFKSKKAFITLRKNFKIF